MKTSANRDLFAYWNRRRGNRMAPERGDIEPDAIRHVLGDSFFLAAGTAVNFPFRLAGTRLCALFGRELKSDSFINLWSANDQDMVRRLVTVVIEEKVGVVAQAIGQTIKGSPLAVNLELLLLPLTQRSPLDARVLGTIVPVTVPFWLGARFIGPLELGAMRHIGPTVEQPSQIAASVPAPPLMSAPAPLLPPTPTSTLRRKLPTPAAPVSRIRAGRPQLVVYEGGRRD
jgi:hypothetical protein